MRARAAVDVTGATSELRRLRMSEIVRYGPGAFAWAPRGWWLAASPPVPHGRRQERAMLPAHKRQKRALDGQDAGVSDDDRLPIESVLPGQRLHPLDEGWTALQTFALVKCLDDDGDVAWVFRTSEPFNLEELLGALTVQVEILKRALVRHWDEDGVE